MTKLKCVECGKSYMYEVDDFCPRCGAYNQPSRTSNAVVRVDGVAENNHARSFTHKEIHREKAVRRFLKIDRNDLEESSHQQRTHQRISEKTATEQSLGRQLYRKKNEQQAPKSSIGTMIGWGLFWIYIIFQFFS